MTDDCSKHSLWKQQNRSKVRTIPFIVIISLALISEASALQQRVARAMSSSHGLCVLYLIDQVQWVLEFSDRHNVNTCNFEVSDEQMKQLRQMYAKAKTRVRNIPNNSTDDIGTITFRKGRISVSVYKEGNRYIIISAQQGADKVLHMIPMDGSDKQFISEFESLLAITNQ